VNSQILSEFFKISGNNAELSAILCGNSEGLCVCEEFLKRTESPENGWLQKVL
jgi:hypothetical protein